MDDTPRQIFHFGIWIFDVTAAKQIIRNHPRAPSPIDVAMWARAYGLDRPEPSPVPLIGPEALDPAYARTTDLSAPLLLAFLPHADGDSGRVLIDGCHRLFKAHAEAVAELPAHCLTVEETRSVLIQRGPKTGQRTRDARQSLIPEQRSRTRP
jgi:hypothetical protein